MSESDRDPAADGVGDADPDLETVVGLLDDETTRAVLAATAREPRSAADLADLADVSRQTVYRRLDRLTAAGLVTDRTSPRPDGHHETVYEATLSELSVELDEDGFSFDLVREEPADDAADRLTDLWRNFQE